MLSILRHPFPVLLFLLCTVASVRGFRLSCRQRACITRQYPRIHAADQASSIDNAEDDIFGAEFQKTKEQVYDGIDSVSKSSIRLKNEPKQLSYEERQDVMKGFDSARVTFIVDSLFISCLGLCGTWYFGTFQDAYSYALGAMLGLMYAALLGRYVESIGSDGRSGGGGGAGSARFAPVILLIAIYGKNKETVSIIPELLGFFGYQLGSFLQIFNENLYGDAEEVED